MISKSEDLEVKATEELHYKVYYGTFVDAPKLNELRIRFRCLVGVDRNGKIDFLEEHYNGSEAPLAYFQRIHGQKVGLTDVNVELVDHSSDFRKFFVPGFVDTHIHASQFPNMGIGLGCPLLDWLDKYTFPLEDSLTDSNSKKMELAKEVYSKVIRKTLSNGTTCASYFTTTDPETTNYFADLLLQQGQRGFVGKVCMDHNEAYPSYEESIEECQDSMIRIIDHLKEINPIEEKLVKPIITPRFAPVCSKKLLKYLGDLSNELDLPIQTHISENEKEVELVKKMFPDCDNYASVYDKHNLLNENTILAHAIHLTPEERQLIKEKKCSISHCPSSNTFIASGEAPVKRYLYDDKINISLGTDISGGFDASILSIVRHAILVSHHLAINTKEDDRLTLADALYMATVGGAIAVNLENIIGSFEVGKKFDTQLIDLKSDSSNIDIFAWQLPTYKDSHDTKIDKFVDLLNKWVFTGDDRNCVKVWCNGRLVVDKLEPWVLVDKTHI